MGIFDFIKSEDQKKAERAKKTEQAQRLNLRAVTEKAMNGTNQQRVKAQKIARTYEWADPNKTVQKPQQSVFNRVRDIMDSNTDMDKFRRSQQAQAINYVDQQRDRGVAERSINQNPLTRGLNFGRAAAESVAEAPIALGRAVGNAAAMNSNDYKAGLRAEETNRAVQDRSNDQMFRTLKDPRSTMAQRNAAVNVLNNTGTSTGMNDVRSKISSENDPRRLAAAAGSLVADVATLGVAGATKTAVKGAYQAGKASTGKVTTGLVAGGRKFAIDTAKTGAMGGFSGGVSPYIQDPNATFKQAATGAVTGAAMGAALPAVFAGASSVPDISRATTKLVKSTPNAVKSFDDKLTQFANPAVKALDNEYKQLNIRWQNATPQMRRSIEQAIRLNRQERNRLSQGGFIANPFYKDPATGKEVLRKGVKEKQIFTGPEGKPQFEVSDRDMKVKDILKHRGRAPIETKLSDVIEHKKMFETYPELADMPVTLRNLDKTNGGGYNRASKRIVINKNWPMAKKEKVILHEAQHAIQHIEDFQRGGGYSKVADIAAKRMMEMPDGSLFSPTNYRYIEKQIISVAREIREKHGSFVVKNNKILGINDPAAKPLIEKFNNLVKAATAEAEKPRRASIQHKAYEDIMGENVARTVTNRRMMTDAERAAKPFYKNMDADPKNAIMVDAKGNYAPIDKSALNSIMKIEKGERNAVRQPNGTNGTRGPVKEAISPEEIKKATKEEPKETPRAALATIAPPKPIVKPVKQPRQIAETTSVTKTGIQSITPPRKPPTAKTPPQLGAGKQKATKFADKTVPNSEFVSDKIKGSIKSPSYSVQTEKQGYYSALSRLKTQGDDVFEQKVLSNLDKKNGTISRQDAIDAQTLAATLDGGDEAAIRKATQIYERLSEHYTAAGQLTQAAAIIARRSPEGLRQYATKALKNAGVTMTKAQEKELTTLVKAVREASPEAKPKAQYKVLDFVAKNTPTSTGDKVINTWRAGLLTAPTTTFGNILGNSGEAAIRKGFVNPIATAADAAMSKFTGKRTMAIAKKGSGTQGFKEGVSTLPEYLKTGYDPKFNNAKYDAPRRINTGSKKLDAYINGTYRLMGTADAPFSSLAEKETLSSLAKAEALNKGLKGKAQSDFIKEFVANPPETALARAQKEADYATFKNPTVLGKAATGLKRPLGPVGDFIVPFTQVPASIATRIIERTPVGTANEMIRQIVNVRKGGTFDQRAMAQSIGNGAVGASIMGIGYALAGDDKLTFGYPTDEKERKLWDAEGKQPFSVRVGDRWYSLNYLQPFGTLLAVGGQAKKAMDDGQSLQAALGQGAATAGQAVMNQSFLKGVGGALDAISDPERSVRKYVEQTTSSIVPNFVRSGARAADEIQRAPEGIVEGIKSGVPGLRGQTTPKYGINGEPLPAKDNFVNQYVNPLKPSKVRTNDTTAELRRLQDEELGTMPTESNSKVFGETNKLDKKQLTDLNASIAKKVSSSWNNLIKTPEYKAMSDEDKKKTLDSAKRDYAAVAKAEWAAKNDKISDEWQPDLTGKQKQIAQGNAPDYLYAGLPNDLHKSAKQVIVASEGADDTWSTQKNTDKYISDALKSWNGGKELPQVTNEVAKQWAEYQKDYKEGKISKTDMADKKKTILKSAYQSGLALEEKDILSSSVSKAELQNFVDQGIITQENLNKALKVEKQMYDAGLLDKEYLARKLGNSARGYKSGGGGGGSSKLYDYFALNQTASNKSLRKLVEDTLS